MKPFQQWRLLPHEILFGAFMLLTWGRLVWAAGPLDRDALIYAGSILANVLLIGACWMRESRGRWRLRLVFYPLAMGLLFFDMKWAVPKIHPASMDGFLQQLDALVVGRNLSLRLDAITCPVLTDVFSFCYILFFPYITYCLIDYLFKEVELTKKFFVGLFSIYGIGLAGYTLFPAQGPHASMAGQFQSSLVGGFFTYLNATVSAAGTNEVDVFPSIHCAASCYFLLFDRRHTPWRYKWALIPCLGLWISTVYLRYHYFVDVLAGFAIAGIGLALARYYAAEPMVAPPLELPVSRPQPAPAEVSLRPQ